MHPVILYQCKTHVALQTLGLFSFSAACMDASFFIMIVVHSYIMFTHSISTPSQSKHCGHHRSRAARAGQIRSPLQSISPWRSTFRSLAGKALFLSLL